MLLWLWCRPSAVALMGPLAWELPYAVGAALEKTKTKQKQKNTRGKNVWVAALYHIFCLPISMLENWGLPNQRKPLAVTGIPRAWNVASYIPKVLRR